MRYFSESISNWEIKEDIADHWISSLPRGWTG